MLDLAGETSDLDHLYRLTVDLLSDEEHMTRALDWVDAVLPPFAAACRREVKAAAPDAIDRWLDWLASDNAYVIEEAGKGEVFAWRIAWMRTLLQAARRLQGQREVSPDVAADFFRASGAAFSCFPPSYWLHLVDYLCGVTPTGGCASSITFPLVLSDPVVDGGVETSVILGQFVLEPSEIATGEVFLAPDQTVMRCMDARFADTFRDAALAARADSTGIPAELPTVSVRIRTLVPGQERFIRSTPLRGESGGGALAVALRQVYTGREMADSQLAISFALHAPASTIVDGGCHEVASTDEKVRGCAKQHVDRLLVARSQQAKLTVYGHMHGVQILGALTVAEAVDTVASVARTGTMPKAAASLREPAAPVATRDVLLKVVVLHYRRVERDRRISKLIEEHLRDKGHTVFVDRYVDVGITWAREIEQHIREADFVIPLLSAASIVSEMLASEIQTADEARQRDGAKPRLIPVRVNYSDPVPDGIAHITERLAPVMWTAEFGDAAFLESIDLAISEALSMPPAPIPPTYLSLPSPGKTIVDTLDLEPFAGLVPVGSRFYVERDADPSFLKAVEQRHSIILVKGARQMGKSSLLARGLAKAEQTGARVALTDFQKLNMADLQTPRSFYLAIARLLARQLKIDVSLDEIWVDHRSANLNFEEYFEDYILPSVTGELVWAMDEVDKLFFSTNFSSDVFGLLRSWANERQGRPSSPWARVSMVIAYATEAHLFITDVNQSPFNVGTRFEMKDFTPGQVADLNGRYGSPLSTGRDLEAFYDLVGGHPYLVRRSLYAMVTEKLGVDALADIASGDNGPLTDHLRRLVALLARNEDNVAAVREVLAGRPCPSFEAFYHLRSAGVLLGDTAQHAVIRCNLYRMYLSRHLG